ncbi:MAG: hypothetical protein KAS72_11485 [Phycisphaerales bacterium]|nr:hypothetical protein [Phycisphaerales bacterium]
MVRQRAGITFVEILTALVIFSMVVTTGLVTLRATRRSLEESRLAERAAQVLDEWLASQRTREPVPAEFTDEDGLTWRIVDEAAEFSEAEAESIVETLRDAPDLDAAVEMLGLDESDEDEEPPTAAGLIELEWSVLRVEVVFAEGGEPIEVLRWHSITDGKALAIAGLGGPTGATDGASRAQLSTLSGQIEGAGGGAGRTTGDRSVHRISSPRLPQEGTQGQPGRRARPTRVRPPNVHPGQIDEPRRGPQKEDE